MSGAYDAAILWPNGKVYFFRGSEYYAFDIGQNTVLPGYPKPVLPNWPGLDVSAIDSAVVWPNGKAYFFRGDRYYGYDIANNAVDPGYPRLTNTNFPGVLAGPFGDHRIDAPVLWPNGKVYFFQHDQYYRFDIPANRVDAGYPLPISGNWPGLQTTGQRLTSALVWPALVVGRQKAYFFHSSLYLRYDIPDDKVDAGYPLPISGNWPGL
jgi:hypothetical protein